MYLIDFNPRVYRSLGLATAAGLNLVGAWVELLLGHSPDCAGYRVGVRWRDGIDDARALAVALLRGPRRSALAGLRPRRHTAHAVFSLHDPLPAFARLTAPVLARRRLLGARRVGAPEAREAEPHAVR